MVMFVCSGFWSGCSLLGWAVGKSIDQHNPNVITRAKFPSSKLGRWDVRQMRPGTTISLSLRDGSSVEGKFVALSNLPEESYRMAYDQALADLSPSYPLPESGATVTVEEMNGQRHRVRFYGVALDTTAEQMPSGLALDERMLDLQGLYLVLLNAGSGTRVAMRLSNLKGIFAEDGSPLLDGLLLRGLVLDGSLPLYTAVILRVDERTVPIGLDRIDSVALTGSEGRAMMGATLAGAAIDTTLTVVILVAIVQGAALAGASAMAGLPGQFLDK